LSHIKGGGVLKSLCSEIKWVISREERSWDLVRGTGKKCRGASWFREGGGGRRGNVGGSQQKVSLGLQGGNHLRRHK